MSGSRSSKKFRIGFLSVALALGPLPPASALVGAPQRLSQASAFIMLAQSEGSVESIDAGPLPPISETPAGEPEPAAGEAMPPAEDPSGPEGAIEPDGSVETIGLGIQSQPLGPVPAEAAGLIGDAQGGLGSKLWQGANPAEIALLMPRLGAPVGEPAIRNLQLRLLLTKAAGPGAFGEADPLTPLRAERLHAMGFDQEALALLRSLPGEGEIDPQEAFEKSLLAGDEDSACDRAHKQIAASAEPYWRKAIVYCQLAAGDVDQAQLGVDILREQATGPGDSDFIQLAEALMASASPQKLHLSEKPDPLRAAMMRRAGLPVPQIQGVAAHKPSGPSADTAVARDPAGSAVKRLAAAFRAFENGLIGVQELVELCRLFPPAGDPEKYADSPRARAQLFVAAERAQTPEQRARALARLLEFARHSATFSAMAPFHAVAIERIPIQQSLAWFAPEAYRVLLLAGKRDLASFWLNLAEGSRSAPQTTMAEPGMKILAQWAGIPGIYDPDPVEVWQATTGANEWAAGKLYVMFAALGQPIVNAGVNGLIAIPGADERDISKAAEAGRRGEVVLRSLVVLGGLGLANLEAAPLAQSLGALTAVGLNQEARALAVATGVAMGL
jgi:hypothetical protein